MLATPLVKKIGDRLSQKNQRLAVAESLTGGRIQSLITSVSGASRFFEGGITTYTLDQKVRHLSVDREHAASCNCVSSSVAKEMAIGVCELFHVDYSIATTGYAEPDIENGIPIPHAFLCVCKNGDENATIVRRVEWNGEANRNAAQEFFATTAIEMLHELVISRPDA